MIKKVFISVMIISFTMISCKKEDKGIIGEWNWLKSYGGYKGEDIRTPEQSGIQIIVIFHENDTVEIFENGILLHKTDYFLSREESMLLHKTFDFMTINYKYRIDQDSIITLPMRYMIRRLSDTLQIEEDEYSGYGHLYERVE